MTIYIINTYRRLKSRDRKVGTRVNNAFSLAYSVDVRQAAGTCNSQADCLPANLTGYTVPDSLVTCNQGICQCSQSCFTLTETRCGYSTCGWYGPNTTICTPINQKSQLIAFFLTLFLSDVGAANFYIGQSGLGKRCTLEYSMHKTACEILTACA